MSALHRPNESLPRRERIVLNLYAITGLIVLILMMLGGAAMRMAQGTWIELPPDLFYQIMTAHGAAMVGIAGLTSSAVMWYFLRQYVRLSTGIFLANYLLFMLGAVLILGSIFILHYGGAWTFLYPLPVKSNGMWSVNAAAGYMLGLIAIGVGFLLFYLDATLAILRVYGNLGRALGLQWLFSGDIDKSHPPTVVASTMVIIANSLGTLCGAVVLVLCLVNAYVPAFELNALLTKNMIYFFGHVFINASIYMGVIAVYELLPRYSGRPWGVSRPFLWAWAASTVMVIIVYPHHLLMDFVMPPWMLVMGQIISFTSGLPVLAVTAYGALTNVHRSGIRWTMPARLLLLSMFGWAAGVIPAIIDAVISVNSVMHNTLWVPGHFHFYLLLGLWPMLFGFMYHVIQVRADEPDSAVDRVGFPVYLVGGLVFVGMLLAAGQASVPRRWAGHLPEWLPYAPAASIGAVMLILATILFALRIGSGLLRAPNVGNAAGTAH